MTRKSSPCWKGIGLILLSALLASGCACAERDSREAKAPGLELVILHVNDTHSHVAGIDRYGNAAFSTAGSRGGLSRTAAAVQTAKMNRDNVIALDAGDQFQGTLYYSVHKWPMLADLDRFIAYDAMTLGNHEFDEGCEELSRFLERVSFPVLAANLAPEAGCPLRGAKTLPYVIREVRGVPVGIVGLANDEVNLASACSQTRFRDREETLRNAVAELEAQGVRHIVALTHLGLPADRELARSVDGVDVIVGGHTHSYLGPDSEEGPYPVVEYSPSGRPVLVVTAGRATRYLGELQVDFSAEGVPVNWSGGLHELENGEAGLPELDVRIEGYTTALDRFRREMVGYQNLDMPDGMEACRSGDCLGGMVTADAMLEYARPYGADLALCNGGAIRAAFPRGGISLGDILTMHPFGNQVVLREYDGEQILDALEHGVAADGGVGPHLLQVAGLRYVVDAERPAGSRVISVDIVDTEGGHTPLDLKARYVVVTLEYLVRGGDGYEMLKKGRDLPFPQPIDVDIVEAYLRAHDPLPSPSTGRIVRTDRKAGGL